MVRSFLRRRPVSVAGRYGEARSRVPAKEDVTIATNNLIHKKFLCRDRCELFLRPTTYSAFHFLYGNIIKRVSVLMRYGNESRSIDKVPAYMDVSIYLFMVDILRGILINVIV